MESLEKQKDLNGYSSLCNDLKGKYIIERLLY